MKLIDMKLPKKTKKQLNEESMPMGIDSEREQYPWGLRLSFEKKDIEKIPALKNIAAGANVKIDAHAKVSRVEIVDAINDKDRQHIDIQIQKIGIQDRSKSKEQIFEDAIK